MGKILSMAGVIIGGLMMVCGFGYDILTDPLNLQGAKVAFFGIPVMLASVPFVAKYW